MKLYHHPLSGHSHRARLFLSLAGIEHELVEATSALRSSPEFLAMNRFKELPVLDDNSTIVPDSIAIMVYAARRYGKTEWLPEEPVAAAAVQRWLSVSTGQLFYGPCAARLVTVFKRKYDADDAIAKSHALLKVLDAELGERDWIALPTPTIADPAFYSYIVAAPEGNVDIAPYKNVDAWLRRVEALPGFVPFQKTKIGLAA